jgi:hypothetical protein
VYVCVWISAASVDDDQDNQPIKDERSSSSANVVDRATATLNSKTSNDDTQQNNHHVSTADDSGGAATAGATAGAHSGIDSTSALTDGTSYADVVATAPTQTDTMGGDDVAVAGGDDGHGHGQARLVPTDANAPSYAEVAAEE